MIFSYTTLMGTDGDDSLVGGTGNDLILGLQGRDEIYGLEGDDSINPGLGVDTVDAGSGNDLLSVDYSSSDPNPIGGPWWNGYVFDWNGFYRSWRMLSSLSQTATGVYSGSFWKSDNSITFSNIEAFNILGTSLSDGIQTGLAADSINSAAGDDVILSGAGNDSIHAADGNDWINAEAGDDSIAAGDGDDSISGADGNDIITAGLGNDSLSGGNGNDTLFGGDGDDILIKGNGIDIVDGGDGFDTLLDADLRTRLGDFSFSDSGLTYDPISLPNGTLISNIELFLNITSGSGRDLILYTQRSNNLFSTGAGNDSINPGLGVDTVDAGSGNDLLSVDYSSSDPNPIGGPSWNGYVFDWNGFYRSWRMLSSLSQTATGVYSGSFWKSDNSITFSNIEAFNILGTSLSDGIQTGLAADSINSAAGDDVILSGAGNDSIDAADGNDWINAEAGDDYIAAGDGDDSISGADGNDIITAGLGNDSLSGGNGNDTLFGGDGDDILIKGNGIDIVDGGDGFDTLLDADLRTRLGDFSFSDSGLTYDPISLPDGTLISNIELFLNITSGSGRDLILYTQRSNNLFSTGAGNDSINPGLGVDTVDAGSGNDLLSVDYSSSDPNPIGGPSWNGYVFDWNGFYRSWRMLSSLSQTATGVYSGSFWKSDNSITFSNIEAFNILGTSLSDGIQTGLAADSINSAAGDDVILSGAGNDYIDAADGNDWINAEAGDDSIAAGDGDDSISGADGNDIITAGLGNDSLSGGNGNDTLFGGDGDDILIKGNGIDIVDGGDGFDTLLDADLRTRLGDFSFSDSGLTYDPISLPNGTLISNIELFLNITSGSGRDLILYTQRSNNLFSTGAGNDSINPGLGVDTVDAGSGNDLLSVDYSSSDPNPIGGPSWNGYVFDWNGFYRSWRMLSSLSQTATGVYSGSFWKSDNSITFSNIEAFNILGTSLSDGIQTGLAADSINSAAGDDVILSGAGNDYIDAADGNDWINAEAGDDSIAAGDGDDSISGADGNDIITAGLGNDSLSGGNGNDTLFGGDGDDILIKGNGIDIVDGGDGFDTLLDADLRTRLGDFSFSDSGLTYDPISLPNGTLISNIELFLNITSGSGRDLILYTQRSNNLFSTGAGNDSINPGLGVDTVDAGSGNDLLSVDYSSSDPNPIGGPSWNGYVFDWNGFYRSWRMLSSLSQTATGVYSGSFWKSDNSITFSNIEAFNILGTSLSDGIQTGLAADSINSAAGDDVILSGAGNDSIDAADGNDWINAEAGDDSIAAGDGDDSISGADGNDIITAGLGNDSLSGGNGNDTLFGGDGDDILIKGNGIDIVDGGNGFDRLIDADMSSRPGGFIYRDTGATIPSITLPNGTTYRNIESFVNLTLGNSTDQVIFTSRENNIIFGSGGNDNINPGLGIDSVNGGAGTDRLTINYSTIMASQGWYHWQNHWRNWGLTTSMASSSSRERSGFYYAPGERVDFTLMEAFTISGTPNADGVDTGDLNDRIIGNGGDDVINSYGGSDWVDGGTGSDLIYAGAGNDSILGGEGTDSVWGGLGNDRLQGDSDADYLCGDDGDDSIYGGTGNDIFSPNPSEQAGNDLLIGDSGDDVFYDSIGINTIDGGSGVDTLVVADLRNRLGSHSYVDDGSTYSPIILSDGGLIRDIEYLDYVFTGSGNDSFAFTTRRVNNGIRAGAGEDVINPGLGGDMVDGGEGQDRLVIDYSQSTGWQRGYFTWNSGYWRNWSLITDLTSPATGDYRGSISTTMDSVSFNGIESFSVTGTSYADGILCGNGNDYINGRGGADVLIPGAGADYIVLADPITEYYDDLSTWTDGSNDYAHITGLDASDILQLQGSAALYQITEGSGSSWIYRLKPEGEPSEMIAFVQGVTGLNLGSSQFVYV